MKTCKFVKESGVYQTWIDFIAIELRNITTAELLRSEVNYLVVVLNSVKRQSIFTIRIFATLPLYIYLLAHDGWPRANCFNT